MKILFLLLLTACSGMSDGEYKRKFHLEDYRSTKTPLEVHTLLTEKMEKCYPQHAYPVFEKTVSAFDPATESGSISYEIDNQSMGPKALLKVEVMKDPEGSIVKVYSKGDLFRPAGVYKHQVHKWLDGKKVDCHSHGDI